MSGIWSGRASRVQSALDMLLLGFILLALDVYIFCTYFVIKDLFLAGIRVQFYSLCMHEIR